MQTVQPLWTASSAASLFSGWKCSSYVKSEPSLIEFITIVSFIIFFQFPCTSIKIMALWLDNLFLVIGRLLVGTPKKVLFFSLSKPSSPSLSSQGSAPSPAISVTLRWIQSSFLMSFLGWMWYSHLGMAIQMLSKGLWVKGNNVNFLCSWKILQFRNQEKHEADLEPEI